VTAYDWYATPVNSAGTSTATSTLVTVWVGATDPGGYSIFIFDANGDGLVNQAEWQSYTGGGNGLNGGGSTRLFDGAPGGAGIIYSATPYPLGTTGLKAGLSSNFTVDPVNLDPSPPPCFCAGTRIAVPNGERRVETLRAGDWVLLADGGKAQLIWAGRQVLSAAQLRLRRHLCPVIIPPGALGCGMPQRKLAVSPQHRVLLRGPVVAERCGTPEVLVPALRLVGTAGIHFAGPQQGTSYHHLLLSRHDLLISEGALTESFYLGTQARRMLPKNLRLTLPAQLGLKPDDRPKPARPFVTGPAARRLLEALNASGSALVAPPPAPSRAIAAR
jgi:hypothetical protein